MMENEFIQIASLLGDATREQKIMWTLLDGKAFTATELAISNRNIATKHQHAFNEIGSCRFIIC